MNSITQPFHVKFFGGGPYADQGMGDKALQSAGEVAGYGRQLLGKNGGLPDLSQMGTLGYIPGLAGQQAQNLGMQNPFAPQDSVMYNDPYKLGAPQQMQLNNQESLIQRAAANARNTARAKLSQSGLLNSTTAAAIENAVNEHAGGEAQTAASNAANQQFAMRQGQLSDWQNMMANLYKNQLGQQQAGASMVAGQIPVQQQVGQQAQANNAATSNFWQSLIGPVLHSTYFPANTMPNYSPSTGGDEPDGKRYHRWEWYAGADQWGGEPEHGTAVCLYASGDGLLGERSWDSPP